jgi:hypothetical protein
MELDLAVMRSDQRQAQVACSPLEASAIPGRDPVDDHRFGHRRLHRRVPDRLGDDKLDLPATGQLVE